MGSVELGNPSPSSGAGLVNEWNNELIGIPGDVCNAPGEPEQAEMCNGEDTDINFWLLKDFVWIWV